MTVNVGVIIQPVTGRKQHIAGVIHQRYLETGIKFIKKESKMNKKYYNDKLTASPPTLTTASQF